MASRATPKKDLELTLEEVRLGSKAFSSESTREVAFHLVCPRLSIASKTALKTLRLSDGLWTGNGKAWTERVLFKETVQGTAGIEVTATDPLSPADLDSATRSSASTVVRFLGDAASDAVGIKALGPLAELPASAIAKLLSGSSQARIAAGGVLDVEDVVYDSLAVGETRDLEVTLRARRDLVQESRRAPAKDGASRVTRKVVAREGDPVGIVRLRLRAL